MSCSEASFLLFRDKKILDTTAAVSDSHRGGFISMVFVLSEDEQHNSIGWVTEGRSRRVEVRIAKLLRSRQKYRDIFY